MEGEDNNKEWNPNKEGEKNYDIFVTREVLTTTKTTATTEMIFFLDDFNFRDIYKPAHLIFITLY